VTGGTEPDPDELLVARLRDLAGRMDPVPPAVLDAARAAFAWRTIDAELAALVEDASANEPALAGIRGEGSVMLSFEAADLTVDLEVLETPGGRRLVGQLLPMQAGTVEAVTPTGSRSAEADDLGRFVTDDVPGGPVRLRCHLPADGRVVQTDWVTL
jgi:hypothetical protein